MASDRNEQDEEEYVERSQWYKAERFHRHPYDHNDPNRRLLRLSDYKREGKATAVPVVKGMTFDVISEKHQQATKAWRELPDYHAWVAVIEQTLFKHQKLNVTSCMCLGLGTLTGTIRITGHPFREVSLAQLVVFESIVDLLKTKFDVKHVYFQEPRFSTLDEEFLQSRGYEILHTPDSDDHMTEETFLFTPGAEQIVVNSSLEAAFPSVYIMHNMTSQYRHHYPPLDDWKQRWAEKLPAPEQKARRNLLTSFMNQRAVRPLPEFNWRESLYNYKVYYKPDAAADIGPWEWEVKEEDWVTKEEAERIWREKGLLPQKSSKNETSS